MELELYEAAKFGDFDRLTNMAGYPHIDFNQTTPMGNNLLHVAAQHKQEDFIKQLLHQCPTLGQYLLFRGNHKSDTPLHTAAKVGSSSISNIFMDFAKNMVSYVEGRQVDQQKELLQRENVDKETAMHCAARYGCSSVVTLLIKKDPQLCSIANATVDSPLHLATTQGHFGIVMMILDASPPHSSRKGFRGMTALHVALHYKSDIDLLKIIVERRPQMIRERDDVGWTPLHYAALKGNIEAVQLFLLHDISAAYLLDNDGDSALHIAAFRGHINVIEELIKASPDAHQLINNKGQLTLHTAVVGGMLNVVKFILQMTSFVDLINKQDNDGNTALHLAALHRRYRIINVLAQDQRVECRLLNKEHLTALDIFDRHKEGGIRATEVYHELKSRYGIQHEQDIAIKDVKKRLANQSVESHSTTLTVTRNDNINNQGKIDSSQQSMLEVLLIAAVLIATVTFAAAFTVPAGFNNDGPNQGIMETFAVKAAFKAFVVFNTIAFTFSALAVFLQLDTSVADNLRARHAFLARKSIFVAMFGLVLSFACGTYVVLPEASGLGVFPYAMVGCCVIIYLIGGLLTPTTLLGGRSFGRYRSFGLIMG